MTLLALWHLCYKAQTEKEENPALHFKVWGGIYPNGSKAAQTHSMCQTQGKRSSKDMGHQNSVCCEYCQRVTRLC